MDPFVVCPTFESSRFIFRKTILQDAKDLLNCYSDKTAARLFNTDNCGGTDFYFENLDEMTRHMTLWEKEYQKKAFIRFSILDKVSGNVIGTIEVCPKDFAGKQFGNLAIVRIDIQTRFERSDCFDEILEMITEKMRPMLGTTGVFTKAVPEATERIKTLEKKGFVKLFKNPFFPYSDYFVKKFH